MYKFKVGDYIYYPKHDRAISSNHNNGLFEIEKITLEVNQHGIDLGHTKLKPLLRTVDIESPQPMNQFVEYDLKHGAAWLVDREMMGILYETK